MQSNITSNDIKTLLNNSTPVIDKWLHAFATGIAANVAGLYSPTGTLIPDMNDQPLIAVSNIEEYYVQVLLKPGITVEINECDIQLMDKLQIETGMYTFAWTDNGVTQKLSTWFSIVVKDAGIVRHNSGCMPV